MAIKETPTNIKMYYKLMRDRTSKQLEEAVKQKEDLEDKLRKSRESILKDKDIYLEKFNINLDKYKEWVDNSYHDGEFLKVAKGLFINRKNDYAIVAELYNLYEYAKDQKICYDLTVDIKRYRKLLELNVKEYTNILRAYYTEVHKKLILEGNGYSFSKGIGWICINRCLLVNPRPTIDYAATKKREQELLSQGKRIWNKEEADWCKRNGIEYKAEDKRVFRKDEYCYEIPLINSILPGGNKLKLEIGDYRHTSCRGKSNDKLIEECNNDTTNICNLPIDLKTKLTLCDKADKLLYTKFIRNDSQKSIKATKASSKNR